MSISLQTVREHLIILDGALKVYDEVTNVLAENRVKFETLSRMPELGEGQLKPRDFKLRIDSQRKRQVQHADILTSFTGAASVDDAREVYMALYVAFNRLGHLKELCRLVELGDKDAVATASEMTGVVTATGEDLIPALAALISAAEQQVLTADAKVQIPELSDIEVVNGASLTLR